MASHNPQPIYPRALLMRWLRRGLALFVLAISALILWLWVTTPLPGPEQLRARAAVANTRVLDRNGKLLYEQPDPLSGYRHTVSLDAIAPAFQQATIAIEDASFYQNAGIDLRGILRAAWSNIQSGTIIAGGSTITQQLTRSFLLDPELAQQQSLERKLREAVLAVKLTSSVSKHEILALYLNQVYYGNLSYGSEAAARTYFAKSAGELDLAEAALLAGLPQAPAHYDPFLNPDAARLRQSQVLDAMQHAGYISAEQASRAKDEKLQYAGQVASMRAPHFVHYVLDSLVAELGPERVLRGGLIITTTLDIDLQNAAELALERQIANLSSPKDGGPNHRVGGGAVLVLDPATGAILSMLGSPKFTDSTNQGQVNATLALRQPGSAIKALTYAAALEQGWTAATMILDIPSSFSSQSGQPYKPENYDHRFHGPLSLREALATSSNVAAVRTLDHIGVPALLEMAHRLGISSLSQDTGRYGLSLTLGSGELRLSELTAAYAAFANGGSHISPYAISAVVGLDGTPLSSSSLRQQAPVAALDPQIAYLISDILSDPYARMPAFGSGAPLSIDRPAAVKTGTTSNWRDNWTIGYTPDRVVGVWMGNPDGQPMQNVSGISGAAPVWHAVMLAAHAGLPARPFVRPAGVVELAVCADSGLLPSATCPGTRLERFARGTAPQQVDNSHVAVRVDRVLACRAPTAYPPERTVTRIFRLLPPEAATWAEEQHMPRPPEQFCEPAPGTAEAAMPQPQREHTQPVASQEPGVGLSSPGAGSIFRMSAGLPVERQQAVFEAYASAATTQITMYVDGLAIASFTQAPFRSFWQLRPGTHHAWVVAYDAAGQQQRSQDIVFTVLE